MTDQRHKVALALGSNLGDRQQVLASALSSLGQLMSLEAVSSIYKTVPVYVQDQPAFLNMAVVGTTELTPEALLKELKTLEQRMGRKPGYRYGPRELDIDIIFYDDVVLDGPALKIPHPLMHERAFVLCPLADIAPHWMHPVLHKSVQTMLEPLDITGIKKIGSLDV